MVQFKQLLSGCLCVGMCGGLARASIYTPVTATARAIDYVQQLDGPGDGISATHADTTDFGGGAYVTYTGHAEVVWAQDEIDIAASMVRTGFNPYFATSDTAQATAVFDLPAGASVKLISVIDSPLSLTGPEGNVLLNPIVAVPVPAGRFTFDTQASIFRSGGVDRDGHTGGKIAITPEPAGACMLLVGLAPVLLLARRRRVFRAN